MAAKRWPGDQRCPLQPRAAIASPSTQTPDRRCMPTRTARPYSRRPLTCKLSWPDECGCHRPPIFCGFRPIVPMRCGRLAIARCAASTSRGLPGNCPPYLFACAYRRSCGNACCGSGGLSQPAAIGDHRLAPIAAALATDRADGRELADWSRALGMSTRTLSRDIWAVTGLNGREWRLRLRMMDAARRLSAGVSVKAVAYALGYAGPASFAAGEPAQFGDCRIHEVATPSRLLPGLWG